MKRKQLIETIIELASDEVTEELLLELAKESYKQLVTRLVGIAYWYKEEFNK